MKNFTLFLIGFILMLSVNLYATEDFIGSVEQGNQVTQKKLNTIKDYKELIVDLKHGAALGDAKSLFWLGTIYYNGVNLKDGTRIKPQIKRSMPYFFDAIKKGSLQAFSFLSLKYIATSNVHNLSQIVKIAQNSTNISLRDKDYFSSVLASLILDSKNGDSQAIETSMKWLYKAEQERPTPKMQFILANMYNMLGNTSAANMYLNKSCANESMKSLCRRYQLNGSKKDKSSCQNL